MDIKIRRFGNVFKSGEKCPACSRETDKGGRLVGMKKKNVYLKCDKCKYTLHGEKAILKQESRRQSYHSKQFKKRI
jgi:uncharacterized Zn finger protein